MRITPENTAVDSREKPTMMTMMRIHIKKIKDGPAQKRHQSVYRGDGHRYLPDSSGTVVFISPGVTTRTIVYFERWPSLTRAQLVAMLRVILAQAGVDYTRYTGH